MIGAFEGWHFPKGKSSRTQVRVQVLDDGTARIVSLDGAILEECRWRDIKVSSRVGRIARRLTLPSGDVVETTDNNAIDQIERRLKLRSGTSTAFQLERSWGVALVAVVLLFVSGYGIIQYGVPYAAHQVAFALPDWVLEEMGEQSLYFLDQGAMTETELSKERQDELAAQFNSIVELPTAPALCCKLHFRKGGAFGANALAMPGGNIVVTDELVALATDDRQILGVMAHEVAHIDKRHATRAVLQSSILGLAIVLLTGDLGGVSELAIALPVILLEAGYSRNYEREADAGAAEVMRALGHSPSHLADLLELLEKDCGPACEAGWLSTHPSTEERAEALRE